MKIINLDEIYNFLVLIFSFEVVKMLKKLMTYLDLRVFSTFHTCSLRALEPKLTAVAWRAQKSWSSSAEDRWTFSGTHQALRSFLMAHKESPHILWWDSCRSGGERINLLNVTNRLARQARNMSRAAQPYYMQPIDKNKTVKGKGKKGKEKKGKKIKIPICLSRLLEQSKESITTLTVTAKVDIYVVASTC